MSYALREAIRLVRSATRGSPWTGQLDKREVTYATEKLIREAEHLQRELDELKRRR